MEAHQGKTLPRQHEVQRDAALLDFQPPRGVQEFEAAGALQSLVLTFRG